MICATYQDRITRFGYTYVEQLIERCGAEVRLLHDREKYSLEEELMDDFMSLIASFSGRFYRLRGYKQQRELLNAAEHVLDQREASKRGEADA